MKTYFLGIAGAGVSALASILKTEGHEVIGSDEGVFPPISDYLDDLGIVYASSFAAENVPDDIDIAIIGTTAKIDPETNPEYQKILALGVPHYSFAEYLGLHTKTRDLLVVAGSFGKSSLTALISSILKSAGKNPGWFVGAIAKNLPTTGNWGTDKEFILEGDEYVVSLVDKRSKFELYSPKNILLSSIVHDHVNMFATMADYESCFRRLISQLPEGGKIFACDDYEPIHRLIRELGHEKDTIWYGLAQCDGFYARNIEIGEISTFKLVTPNDGEIELKTSQLGMHNIENIIAASAYCLSLGLIQPHELQKGVMEFQGVLRRLDKKTTMSKIPTFEGFGSSYEKARSAIEAMELHFANRPLIVVFEPHTFSWRNRDSLHWYDEVFEGVDKVYMLPPPVHGANNHSQVTIDEILARVLQANVKAEAISNAQDAIAKLSRDLKGDEAILLLSSGPLDGLVSILPKWLDDNFV